ncbi:MAG: UvrD-helicase domain-containing protein, partial [Clostridia bacterium]|nr:UvrD-helicase domain-containing protein [Clostridia bacterium]
MPKFTVEQQKAIDDRNVNILVAAAAGSGKTTILVERIKKLIIEENCSLENMLVVTFTELAAKEMKEKIIKAIDNAVFDADDSLRQRLKKELAIIPNANISTFHSFALEIIRKFYYLIGIEPNLKIIDDIQKNILLAESMEELTDYYFKKEDRRFIEFLNCYTSGKNISAFGEMVSAVYNKIMAMAEPFEWLKESIALSSLTKDEFIKSPQFKSFISGITAKLDTYLDFIETKIRWAEGENLDTLIGYLEPERAILSELKQMLQEERYDEISEYKPAAKKNISKIKGQIHAGVNLEDIVLEAREDEREFISKKICNAFFFDSMEHMVEDMNKTVPHLEFLEEAVKKYHEIFCKKKAKKAYMTFNDIEHYAFEILKHSEAAAYYRDKFEHIFIDEFQDTNGVQFAITSLFAREDNLFMVGDVKQSIYRFRQADPTLFEERYNTFKELEKNDPKGSRSEAIDLNANFRSRRSVVEYVNTIFSDVMENYDDNAKLNGKCLTYDEPAQDAILYLLENEGMMSDSSDDSSSGDEASNSILEMSNTQKEALATVKLINEYKRRFGYQNKDFAILLRSVKNRADIYYETLAENNIASYINDNDGYFDTIEINTLC